MKKQLRLIYIIGTYPLLTMTFVDREIKMLRQFGVDLSILAVRKQDHNVPLSFDQLDIIKEGLIYLLPISVVKFILSQLYFILFKPLRYFGAFFYLITRSHKRIKVRFLTPRLMTFLHFLQSVYAAYLIRGKQFDELHAHTADRAATIALVSSRLLGKPYSLSIHAGHDIFVNPVLLPEKIYNARHVATCTAYNKIYLENIIGENFDNKISYIRHGLDLTKYVPSKSSNTNKKPIILSVGRLSQKKGFTYLIKSCKLLRDQGYNFKCYIVGEGPQRKELLNLIEQLSLNSFVILLGKLQHEAVIDKYREATLFVLSCIKSEDGDMDGIPNVLAEAMAMGVPVISSDLSGISELITHNYDGILTPPGDEKALTVAIVNLLNNKTLRDRLSKSGRKVVFEKFEINQNVKTFAEKLWPSWFNN